MSFPKPVVSFRPPVPRRSNTTRPESDTEKEEASSPMTGSGEGKRVSLAPSARLRPDANQAASKNRPVSVGLNRDFLAALDKSLGTEKRASVVKSMSTTEDVPTTRPKPPSRPSHRRSVSVTHPGGSDDMIAPPTNVSVRPRDRGALPEIDVVSPEATGSRNKRRSTSMSRTTSKILKNKLSVLKALTEESPDRQRQRTRPVKRPDRTQVVAGVKEDFAYFLMNQSLRVLGLSDEDIAEAEKLLKSKFPPHPENRFTSLDSSVAAEISRRLEDFAQSDNNHLSAKKIQSLFRMYCVRKRFRTFLDNPDENRRLMGYARCLRNMIKVEQTYCTNLRALVKDFLVPARLRVTSGREILKLEEISYIFCNFEVILELHQKLLEALQAVHDHDWPFVRGVGKIILDARKGLTAYGVYVGNYVFAEETVTRLRSDKNGKVTLWFQELEEKSGLQLLRLLAAPLTHISSMESSLRQMLTYVAPEEEYDLGAAFGMIHETSKFVTEQLSRSETTAILTQIQKRITHEKPLNLVQEDRRFLLESQFAVGGSRRIFILLSDLLIVGKPTKSSQFKLKEMTSLKIVQFERLPDTDNAFIIKSPTAVYKLTGKPEDCRQWIAALSEYEERNKYNRAIGVPLVEILKRENVSSGVPSIVTQCIEHIRATGDGTHTEGLFRISGEHKHIDALKKIFDQVAPEHRDLSPYSIHAVAGTLKLFFREMPEPLLTFAAYDQLVNIARSANSQDLNEEQTAELAAVLQGLGEHLPTLKYLIRFLVEEVCPHAAVNKMTPSNLSIVFGPTLLRPQKETMETTLNSPLVNSIVQSMIELADRVLLVE